MKESNRIELKRELTDSLEKEVVAFLNYREGGHIYIGVDDATGAVVGVPDCDAVQFKVKDRIKNNLMASTLGLFDVIENLPLHLSNPAPLQPISPTLAPILTLIMRCSGS